MSYIELTDNFRNFIPMDEHYYLDEGKLKIYDNKPPLKIFQFENNENRGNLLLKVENLCYSHSDSFKLKNIHFQLNRGELLTILGKNGSGKSTLAKLLFRILKADDGNIMTIGKKRLLFQHPEKSLFALSIYEDIAYWAKINKIKNWEERIPYVFNQMNLPLDILQTSPFELSKGILRRVCIASILIDNPDIILMDEPFSDLDFEGMKLLLQSIQKLLDEGKGIVLLSCTSEEIFSKKVVVLKKGEQIYYGDKKNIYTDDNPKYLFA